MDLAGHLLIFAVAAIVALAAPLTLGRLIRPKNRTPDKSAIYDCGEEAIGSSYLKFDLRFYVVALLFIVFDVELAFLFPWAAVYGSAIALTDPTLSEGVRLGLTERLGGHTPGTLPIEATLTAGDATRLAIGGALDLAVFFGVLLVGFAYVWKRGDLDWVKTVAGQARQDALR
ncbi:NADH-quinone oxidoreductase subunit A [Alienimonas chondri]|uniref:NADH-quinone oxidoreductase subunit n=1 Tax=Alienimonas chondri TaxID=2681879 RepID=A0ABX1V9V0_9PLAN|nr:NADH-quinone oxidoreductase subunit A [Alienimonas chondri]NNJ24062.1 NAD(P)H-quinone oxidoreductase subunit 3 [Alienimonas chondri]